jgi:hypothetical protein
MSPPYAVAPFCYDGPGRGAQSRWAMAHTRFVITTSAAVLVGALAGCTGSSFLRPKPVPVQTLQFQTEPPGADVHTEQDQTCQTPCSLAVRSESQAVTFTKDGFLPQTVQVSLRESAKHSLFSKSTGPALIPNPVEVALQRAAPQSEPITKIPPLKPVTRQEPPPAIKHYWPSSAPMAPQPEASPSPLPQLQ